MTAFTHKLHREVLVTDNNCHCLQIFHVIMEVCSSKALCLCLCQDSSEGREDFQPDEVAQWWGEWSSWSTCSRTCGGGVRSQERHCLQQSRISFKQHQCSQFNAKAFGRKHYEWVPLYPDDYINISNKPCDLQCTTTTGERQLLVPAHDGTFCRDGIYQGVCIEGQCQVVGCDGKLYSSKTIDKCGVCGGNGGSCYRVSGSYRKGITQLGYVFITNIPVGATDIQIIERRKTENILALSDEAGHFFFNGNSVIDNPQNFHVAGTVFKYRRPANLFSDGFEYIMAQGPTHQALNVMYYNLNGKMPHITYEYTVPQAPELRAAPPMASTPEQPQISNLMSKTSKDPSSAEQKVNMSSTELSSTHNEIEARKEYGKKGNQSTSLGLQDNVEVHVGSDSNLIDGDPSISDSNDTSVPVLKSLFYDGAPWPSGSRQPCKDSSALVGCAVLKLNSSLDNSLTLEIYPACPTCTDGRCLRMRPAAQRVQQVKSQAHTDSETHLHFTSNLTLYSVSVGISTSYALCVKYDGSEVDESYCNALTRPEPTHEFCTGKECLPRWETSRWSECSRTCGEGFQFRTVRCWKMMAPGFDSSVYDELCQAVELQKPITRKACKSKSCGPQWEISDWSECSAQCGGHGVKSREVRCSMEARLCNESTRPVSQRECEGPPCDRRWTVSDWGPCSGPCGEGRMRRYVVCKNSSGKVISDGQCDPELKPLAVHPCGDKNCPAHWVEQEWEQCNATCGRGVKTRQVVCAGLEGGVFKEYPERMCDRSLKSVDSAACFERPCSKWFTTSWSKCSKTCGIGVRVREVKCYQGEELGHSCDSTLRPVARQSCEVQPCTTEPPAEDACQDKATANCALVLRVKLCTHWYYRKACCLSCRSKSQ
uniref:ADAMTS-like protein 2 n=1 Tax=Sinocyclocheilus grahami TaxID=75366 RepID=A0A672T1G4_SINGR